MTAMAATPTHTFRVHAVDRDVVWRIVVVRADGTVTDVAFVRWTIDLHYPSLARDRIARGLDGRVDRQPGRTWGWRPVAGTHRAELLHNGVVVGEIDWVGAVRGKSDRMIQIVDAMNEPRGHDDPHPEPRPPVRHPDYIPGGHDFRTGKDVAA